MAKEPPQRGDRVKLKGRPNVGTLTKFNPTTSWATVAWEDTGPVIVSLKELEKVDG